MGLDPSFTPEQIEAIQAQADPQQGIEIPPKKKRTRENRSGVWQHYRKGEVRENGTYDALCNYCDTKYEMGQQRSTSSMKHHIAKGCKKIPSEKRHKPIDALQQMLQTARTQGTASPTVWHFDQAKCRKSLAKMVIVHEYPFNCVTHHYLREFLSDLQPQFKLVSRTTLRSDCIKIYEEEKSTLYELLTNLNCKVSFTSELWTNKAGDRGFMSLTCHFIDDKWQLKKRILNFSNLLAPHTEAIFHRLVMWNLDKKCFSLTLDNASSNDSCIKELLSFTDFKKGLPVFGVIFHQRCSCHILNLIVQDGLDTIPETIQKLRDTMKWLRHSQARIELFKHASSQVNAPTNRRPALDVATRWNSTYLMLDLALHLKPAIIRYASLEKKFKHFLDDYEWETVNELVGYLKVFYEATLKLSGTKYPTLNLFFPEYCEVFLTIKKMADSPYPFIVTMGKDMFLKWDKYWKCGNTMLALACILDPRCKMVVVEYYYSTLYPDDSEEGFLSNLKACLLELFKEYSDATKDAVSTQPQVPVNSNTTASSSTSFSGTRAGLKDFIREKRSTEPVKNDVDAYLSDPLDAASLEEPFDILNWWKLNAPKYPILARLSRDILAVPISTVASEGIFSTSGRVLSPVRNSLNDESMEALICAQDWLRAKITENGDDIGEPLWNSEETGNE